MVERLNKSLLYTFGVADMLFILMVNMEMFYFAAFLTDYAQFSMTIVGLILWITGVVDIACALVAGVILQKTTLRFGGKYRSWLLVGPPIVAPLFLLQFTKIGIDTLAATIIMFGFITSHLLYNVVFTATGSMVGRLSQLPDERTILSASRAQGMSASGLIFSATALPMITFFGAQTNKITGFAIAVGVYALLMILGYLYIYKITAGKDPYDESTSDSSRNETRQSMGETIRLVFKNPPLLLLSLAETFRSTCVFITTAFAFYYFAYVLNKPAFLSMFILATSVAALIGTFAAGWIGVKIGKRNTYWTFLILAAVSFASAKFLGGTAWSFTAIFSIASFFANAPNSMSTALFSDTVIFGEWKTGKNIRAFTMALGNFQLKLGILIRSAVITTGLVAIGFVANTVPTPSVINGISSIMIFTPAAACAIAAIVFYYGYKIEDRHILEMQDEINARRASDPVTV
jgi:GPH family glycoside/pentoside/hexuronide:cation symporter/glucuronide carrier protein